MNADDMSLKSRFSNGVSCKRPCVQGQLPHHVQAFGRSKRTPVFAFRALFVMETAKDPGLDIVTRSHRSILPSPRRSPETDPIAREDVIRGAVLHSSGRETVEPLGAKAARTRYCAAG